MKHLFQPLSEVPHAANPRTSRNPADIVRLLVFLTTGTLFLPAVTAATSVVALIDNTNHRVVIAADCRVNRQLASLSQCKIIDKPGCTVAMAGLYEEKTTAFHLRRRSKRLWPNARKQDNRSDFRGHPKWTDCADRQRAGGQFSGENKCGAVREHRSVVRAGRIFSGCHGPHPRTRQVSSRLGKGGLRQARPSIRRNGGGGTPGFGRPSYLRAAN